MFFTLNDVLCYFLHDILWYLFYYLCATCIVIILRHPRKSLPHTLHTWLRLRCLRWYIRCLREYVLRKQHPDLLVYQTHHASCWWRAWEGYGNILEPGEVKEIPLRVDDETWRAIGLDLPRKGSHDYPLHYSALGASEAGTHVTHDTFLVKAWCQANGRRANPVLRLDTLYICDLCHLYIFIRLR